MRERTLENRLQKTVRSAGGLCIKLPAIWYKGIPDRMVLLPKGRIFFVELKADGGRISKAQNRYIKILQKLGFNCDIIIGQTQLEAFLDQHVKS